MCRTGNRTVSSNLTLTAMSKVLNLRKKSVQPIKTSPTVRVPKERVVVATVDKSNQPPHIYWEAPSFYYNPQKRYLSLLIISLLSGAAALLIFNYDTLTSIFLIMSSLVLILYGTQKPTISRITISQSGILVDDRMYNYRELKSFWIEYRPGGIKELSLESARWYLPYIKIMLNNQNPVEVRSLVINFLPEKEHENSLVDHLGRKIGL